MTGSPVSWERISARMSIPSRPGKARSSRIRSKGCSPMRCKPASPVAAVSTTKPSISSRVCKDSRISASSSMMRTTPAMPDVPFTSEREITAASDIFGLGGDSLPAQGEIESESGALPGMAFHANFAGMFLDDAVGDRKAETGATWLAFARRSLGGKERIVNALNVLGGNAAPGVGHAHADTLAVDRGYAQRAAARHGVFRVQEQVQEHLLQSSRIALNGGQPGLRRVVHFDLGHLELVFEQSERVGDYFVDIHIADLAATGAREIQQVVYDLRGAEGLPRDLLEQGGLLRIALQLLAQHLGVGGDDGQRSVDFVSHACREQADGGKLIGLGELGFEIDAFGDVVHDHKPANDLEGAGDQRRHGYVHGADFAGRR